MGFFFQNETKSSGPIPQCVPALPSSSPGYRELARPVPGGQTSGWEEREGTRGGGGGGRRNERLDSVSRKAPGVDGDDDDGGGDEITG